MVSGRDDAQGRSRVSGRYGVKFIGDEDLPEGQDWALVVDHADTWFVVKESRITPEVLEAGWAAYRQSIQPHVPSPRRPLLLQIA